MYIYIIHITIYSVNSAYFLGHTKNECGTLPLHPDQTHSDCEYSRVRNRQRATRNYRKTGKKKVRLNVRFTVSF